MDQKIRNDEFGRVVHSSQRLIRLVAMKLTCAEDKTAEIDVAGEVVEIVGYIAEMGGRCTAVAVETARRKAEAE